MAGDHTRIPRNILKIVEYLRTTDDWQLSIDPATTAKRYLNWGWTAAQSDAWTAFRTSGDSYWTTYELKETRDTDTKNRLIKLIDDIVKYDDANRLLNAISDTPVPPADLLDFEKFRIKRGSPMEDKTITHSDEELGHPIINIDEVSHLLHRLQVTNPASTGLGKGKGIKDIQVYRALVAAGSAEPAADKYLYIGDTSRGYINSTFTIDQVRMDAWYIACLESTNKKKGPFCVAVKATVI